MNPLDLIPEIGVGKRYLWRSSLIECLCPQCGANQGNSKGDFTIEVIILSPTIDAELPVYCQNCGHITPSAELEGWYNVKSLDNGELGSVPYTQLEEIEED